MGEMPNIDWNIFLNAAKTVSDRFTESELREIHEIAVRLDKVLKTMNTREAQPVG